MSYIAMSSVVWVVMNCLGEMTTYLPVRGVSVPYFIHRFTEPSLGFAIGKYLGITIYSSACVDYSASKDTITGIPFLCY